MLKLESMLKTSHEYREWVKARSSKFLRNELGALKSNPQQNSAKIRFITFVLDSRCDD